MVKSCSIRFPRLDKTIIHQGLAQIAFSHTSSVNKPKVNLRQSEGAYLQSCLYLLSSKGTSDQKVPICFYALTIVFAVFFIDSSGI